MEMNDDNYIEFESYDIEIDGETFLIEIDREAELFWLEKDCLSFKDAIWFNNVLIECDYHATGFKPWNVPVFNRHIGKDEFLEMMEYFNIDK